MINQSYLAKQHRQELVIGYMLNNSSYCSPRFQEQCGVIPKWVEREEFTGDTVMFRK